MYLLTRMNTVKGSHERTAMEFAPQMTEHVRAVSGLDLTLSDFIFGQPPVTLMWSAMVEDHAVMLAAIERLAADETYTDLSTGSADLFIGPSEDHFRAVVHTAGEMTDVSPLTTTVVATCCADRISDATAWAVEMTDLMHRLTGEGSMFLTDAYGPFGGVAWFMGLADMAAVESMREALRSDEEYLALLARSAGLFLPGSASTSLSQRLS
ncbi:MAG: hypothetical protein JWM47_3816 [Acidimicrobiales bacterium]|nr:hypothetical protein [Acidimicrobiales bacterium]